MQKFLLSSVLLVSAAVFTPWKLHPPMIITPVFQDNFDGVSFLVETVDTPLGINANWRVTSGAFLDKHGGVGKTPHGELYAWSFWRLAYNVNNPTDTDGGYHPQNIFRMPTKTKWHDYTQQAYFRIDKNNLSASPNRNSSNGLLLFNRYQDQYNLYYAGLRVDGYAVIKKKRNGIYSTLAYTRVFPGTYDRADTPNLLPIHTWLGLRSVVKNNADGTVEINLYVDRADDGRRGNWALVAKAVDGGRERSGPSFSGEGFAGIRTDFMDVSFDEYLITGL